MLKLLLPIGLAALGTGAGIGAGVMLRPDAGEAASHAAADAHAETQADHAEAAAPKQAHDDGHGGGHDDGHEDGHGSGDAAEYVKLNNQFVVPVVTAERVESLVVLSLSLEIAPGNAEVIYRREPKLRDGFLQVLFDHANMGGFRGGFTDTARLDVLRGALREVAQTVIGPSVGDVLITDIARQDI